MTPLEGTRAWVEAWKDLRIGTDGLIAEHLDTWTELEGDHGVDLVKEDAR